MVKSGNIDDSPFSPRSNGGPVVEPVAPCSSPDSQEPAKQRETSWNGSAPSWWKFGKPHRNSGYYKAKQARRIKFCEELLANGMNPQAAAKAVGYANYKQAGMRLLCHSGVKKYLEKRMEEINGAAKERTEILLNKMRRLNDFNLMKATKQCKDGIIFIEPELYDQIAEEIGDCVTDVMVKTAKGEDGSVVQHIGIKLMSREKMFELEARYRGLITDKLKIEGNVSAGVSVDWDRLADPAAAAEAAETDVVEGEIVKAALPSPSSPHGANGKATNGHRPKKKP